MVLTCYSELNKAIDLVGSIIHDCQHIGIIFILLWLQKVVIIFLTKDKFLHCNLANYLLSLELICIHSVPNYSSLWLCAKSNFSNFDPSLKITVTSTSSNKCNIKTYFMENFMKLIRWCIYVGGFFYKLCQS